jgi:hypothetical protein
MTETENAPAPNPELTVISPIEPETGVVGGSDLIPDLEQAVANYPRLGLENLAAGASNVGPIEQSPPLVKEISSSEAISEPSDKAGQGEPNLNIKVDQGSSVASAQETQATMQEPQTNESRQPERKPQTESEEQNQSAANSNKPGEQSSTQQEKQNQAGQSKAEGKEESRQEETTPSSEAISEPSDKAGKEKQDQKAAEVEESTLDDEQIRLQENLDKAGQRLVDALVGGENAPNLKKAIEDFTRVQMEKEGLLAITSNELIRNAAQQVVEFLKGDPLAVRKRFNSSEREQLMSQKEMQERIKKIIQLEVEVVAMPLRMEALKKQASEIKRQLISRMDYLKKPVDDPEARKKRIEFYGLLLQLGNLKAEGIKIRHVANILSIQLADLRREVMVKSGMFKGIGGLILRIADWAYNRVRKLNLAIKMNFIEKEFDFDYDTTYLTGPSIGLSSL